MKNTKDIIKSLDNHKMFVNIDSELLKKLKSQKILKGFRNDGAGSRLMCYVNLVRFSEISHLSQHRFGTSRGPDADPDT